MALSREMKTHKSFSYSPALLGPKTLLVTQKWEEISVSRQEIGLSSSLGTSRYIQRSHFTQQMLFPYEIEQNGLEQKSGSGSLEVVIGLIRAEAGDISSAFPNAAL